nr:MAG TPA: Mannosyl-glycoprotein endo-beta-N-acetylglucosaminidase [Bacteriophage sp.]
MPGSNRYRKFNSDRDFTDYYLNLMTSRYRNAIDANDLGGFVNALKQKGYFKEKKKGEYFDNLNGLKSFDRAVAQDLAARRDFYN